MGNPEHVAILKQGVAAWNVWREEHPDTQPDLSEADLFGTDLRGANLGKASLYRARLNFADLRRATLHHASLNRADLSEAHLTEADLGETRLIEANLFAADLSGTNLSGAFLEGANLVRTNFTNADLTGCRVYGVSAWNVNLAGATQKNLVITSHNEPMIQVDDLEVAQFIYLLLNRQKLRNVITTLGEKGVLILGRFTERKDLLGGIAAKLREFGYLPIIFDFERPTDRGITETVKILAGLSAFVIADITNPRSVPLELQATVPDYMVPFVTIWQSDQPMFSMFDDLPRKYHWALPLLEYPSPERLLANFEDEIIQPALMKLEQVRYEKAAPPARRKIK